MPRQHRPSVIAAPVALAASAVLLAGCTGELQGPGADGSWYAADQPYAGQLQIEGFAVADPINQARHDRAVEALGTAVEVSVFAAAVDARSFASAAEAGDAPDLIYADRADIGYLAARGAIMPLDRCIQEAPINLGQYSPAALAQVTLEERIFALPDTSTVPLLVTTSATTGTERGGALVESIGAEPREWRVIQLWAAAEGTPLVTPDGRTATFDDPRIVAALDGWAEPSAETTLVESAALSAGVTGGGDEPDVEPQFGPVVDGAGEPIAVLNGYGWAIPVAGANPATACGYVRAVTESETWIDAVTSRAASPDPADAATDSETDAGTEQDASAPGGGDVAPLEVAGLLTANTTADAELRGWVTDTDDASAATLRAAVDEAYEAAVLPTVTPADVSLMRIWSDAVDAVRSGELSAAEALAEAQLDAQSALDRGWANLAQALDSRTP
ncbi:hypothetical protein [Microcella alkaliphila]|uniref:Sugar ABC transporter substrate-binding protein n=1 Tax=Microcella alkaliphila TaxID=279828 RepID=A0A0U5BCJ6_9MICO|nr:hypothetical protein [Microcella alkaliphila]BAU30990.1 sugar ABC transporter substrate-binding protein [Microcella alkaliphila]